MNQTPAQRDFSRPQILSARVIPWEGGDWGIEVVYKGGKYRSYHYGASKDDAERAARSIEQKRK
jgi:hypothetical protein